MQLPTDFDYHYFDDPDAYGYRGYARKPYGDQVIELWEEAANFCSEQKVASVLDIGCAKGFLVEALLAKGINAKGYDISDYALSFAEGLPCYKHDVRDGMPDSADAVIALGILMYLTEEELAVALREIWQSANKLFLFSAHYEGNRQILPDPLRVITRPINWWRAMIGSVGFTFYKEKTFFDVYVK